MRVELTTSPPSFTGVAIDHLESVPASGRSERPHVAATVVPELKVLAHEDPTHVARADETAHELVGGERRELLREMEDDHVVRAGLLQQTRSLVDVRQRRRRCSRARAPGSAAGRTSPRALCRPAASRPRRSGG